MKALVYHSPNNRAYEEKPKPKIQESTDSHRQDNRNHNLWNRSPYHERKCAHCYWRTLGYEGVGIIEAYDTFGNASEEKALKVTLKNE